MQTLRRLTLQSLILALVLPAGCPRGRTTPPPPVINPPPGGGGGGKPAVEWSQTQSRVASAPDLQLSFNNTPLAERDNQDALHVVFSDGQNVHHGVLNPGAADWIVRPLIQLNADARATRPTLGIISDNLMLAAWTELRGSQRSVVVARSLNRGELWEPPLLIAQGDFDEPISLYTFNRAGGSPGAVLAWTDLGLNRIVSSTWLGTAWSASDWTFPSPLSSGLLSVARDVAVGGFDSTVVAAWEDNRLNPFSDVFIAVSTDGGLNWSADTQLPVPATALAQGQDPAVALRSAERVYIAFQNEGNVYMATSLNGGTSFGEPELIGPGLFGHVVVNRASAGAVAWEHFTGDFRDDSIKRLGLAVTLDDFATLTGPHALPGSSSVFNVVQPAVAISNDFIDVFWVDVGDASERVLRHRSGTLP